MSTRYNDSMIKSIEKIISAEQGVTIAVLSEDETLIQAIKEHTSKRDGECVDLRGKNLKRIPFSGEYFENIILDQHDEILKDPKVLTSIKKVLQKSRRLLIISREHDNYTLPEILEPYAFRDFSTIEIGDLNLNIAIKWYTFAQ
jgi:hypothetical protein